MNTGMNNENCINKLYATDVIHPVTHMKSDLTQDGKVFEIMMKFPVLIVILPDISSDNVW